MALNDEWWTEWGTRAGGSVRVHRSRAAAERYAAKDAEALARAIERNDEGWAPMKVVSRRVHAGEWTEQQ